MLVARRVRLRPSRGQRIALAKAAGAARWAWNFGLRRKTESYGTTGKSPSAVDLHRELNALKKKPLEEGGVPWMYESSKCAPQEALRDLDTAYKSFFRRCQKGDTKKGFPKFKAKRHGEGHFRLTGSIVATDTHLQLPRIGDVRIAPGDRSYAPSGKYSSVSVVQEHGEWYASVRVESFEAPAADQTQLAEVGIDLGARKLAVLATPDGGVEVIPNRRALLKEKRKLRAAQKVLSRRVKGSARRRRAAAKVGRIHRRIADVRKDMTHKATTSIARRFRVVAMEELKLKNMTRSVHGAGRAAKSGLNRVLLDANLAEFRRQLAYKLTLSGGRLVLVDPAYTSRRCSRCGSFGDPGSSEVYACAVCGAVIDRDANAAKNILSLARGEVDAASWTESENARGEAVRRRSLRTTAHASMKRVREGGGQNVVDN